MADPIKFSTGGVILPLGAFDPQTEKFPVLSGSKIAMSTDTQEGEGKTTLTIKIEFDSSEKYKAPFDKADDNFIKKWNEKKLLFLSFNEGTFDIRGTNLAELKAVQPNPLLKDIFLDLVTTLAGGGKINSQSGF